MNKGGGKPVRRLRAVPPQTPTVAPRETAETVLPGLPRVGALDALLREVDNLRLSLETDLSLAASAVEAGAPGIAADIIDSDRDGLRAFEARALGHLSDLAEVTAVPAPRRRWWTHVPAAPFVAAAAVVGFLVGVGPQNLGGATDQMTATPASASQSLAQLTELAATGKTSQVRDAAVTLHSQLMALVGQAMTDPAAAQRGLAMLLAERAVIAQSGDSQALGDVLAASTHLSNLIIQALPASARAVATTPVQPTVGVVVPTTTPTAKPSTAPTPSTKPTTKPTNKPSATPSTSTKPAPSSSPSDPGVLPTHPAFGP
jgi:hypothetical protein